MTPGRSQSRLDCEDYLSRLFRGCGEKAASSSFCFPFLFFFFVSRLFFISGIVLEGEFRKRLFLRYILSELFKRRGM